MPSGMPKDEEEGTRSHFGREAAMRPSMLQNMPCGENVSESKEERDENIQRMLKEVSNENALYLASLTEEERMIEMKQCEAEVMKLHPKIREYLLKRARPSARRDEESSDKEDVNIKALEVIEQPVVSSYEISADTEAPTRVAVDPIQYDLAQKCREYLSGNRELAVSRLFEMLQREHESKEGHYSLHSLRKSLPGQANLTSHTLCVIGAGEMRVIRQLYMHTEKVDKWRLNAGIAPDVDPAWFLVPLKQAKDLSANNETESEHQLNVVTNCLLFVNMLLHGRAEYARACAPFVVLYAAVLRVFTFGHEIFSDVIVHALLGAIYGEHVLPQVTCTRKRPTLKPEAATDTYDTLQQLYARAVHEYMRSGMGDELYKHVLLCPLYCDSPTLVRALFEIEDAAAVRTMTWSKEEELMLPTKYWSPSCTTACRDTELLVAYARSLTTGALTNQRNSLLCEHVRQWLIEAVKNLELDTPLEGAIRIALEASRPN